MEKVEMWKAFDGAIFPSEAACKSHEREHSYLRLVGLTLEQVTGAVNGEDPSLGIAIEIVGAAIARSRRNRGELRKAAPARIRGSTVDVAEADEAVDEQGFIIKSKGMPSACVDVFNRAVAGGFTLDEVRAEIKIRGGNENVVLDVMAAYAALAQKRPEEL